MPAPTPVVIPQPFADDGTKNVIPDTTADTQRASFQLGFPPRTMQPIDAGGAPMLGPDMNGILNQCTQWLYALQGGQIQPYRSDVSDALGGYAEGSLVLMANGGGYWLCTADANETDPDAGGAGWEPIYAYGASAITGLTGGDRTLSAVEAARYFIVLTGALVTNQQIIVPNAYRNYLIVNACTGAFTLTVKTAAGTGVAVPAGGAASPTAVWCDTVDVNPVFVPSALPTSVAPDPNTIVLRDNLGRQFAPTAAAGTRTTQVATTAFANPAGNGTTWRKNADGTVEAWGFDSRLGSSAQTVTFPLNGPNPIFSGPPTSFSVAPRRTSGDALGQMPTIVGTPGQLNFQIAHADGSAGSYWRALGPGA